MIGAIPRDAGPHKALEVVVEFYDHRRCPPPEPEFVVHPGISDVVRHDLASENEVKPGRAFVGVLEPEREAVSVRALRFGRNTLGIPPSRALSAGRLAGLGAHVGFTTGY